LCTIKKNVLIQFEKINDILIALDNLLVDSVSFYFEESKDYDLLKFDDLFNINKIVSNVIFFNQKSTSNDYKKIICLEQFFEVSNHNKNPFNFNWSYNHFLEAKKFNTYFNRKIFINLNGDISDTYLFEKLILNINDSTKEQLEEIINDSNVWKLWTSKKDDTIICKQCEFRYICNDIQIPDEIEKNKWILKEECNYNPLISKWDYEKDYQSIYKFGQIEKSEFIIDEEKVSDYNKLIWK
jgi:radical SAM protein with 4Fe4S-binding SPASM domain